MVFSLELSVLDFLPCLLTCQPQNLFTGICGVVGLVWTVFAVFIGIVKPAIIKKFARNPFKSVMGVVEFHKFFQDIGTLLLPIDKFRKH